jgi:methionyl-tRNA formyltransferase
MSSKSISVLFFGSGSFGLPTLEVLQDEPFQLVGVVTQPDKASGRGGKLTPTPIKQALASNPALLFQPARTREVEAELIALSPDVMVVADFGQLIPDSILGAGKIVNLHPSLLPKYRGPAPIQTAVLNGDTETGVTLMEVDSEIDHAPIIAQVRAPIDPRETSLSLNTKLAQLAAELLVKELPRYLSGELTPQPQNHDQATYTKKFTKEDGQLDWSKSTEEIDRQIRACTPWPGTYTHWDGKLLKVLEAKPTSGPKLNPGQVAESFIVGTSSGALKVEKVQLEGKNPASAVDFLRGYPRAVGSILG